MVGDQTGDWSLDMHFFMESRSLDPLNVTVCVFFNVHVPVFNFIVFTMSFVFIMSIILLPDALINDLFSHSSTYKCV